VQLKTEKTATQALMLCTEIVSGCCCAVCNTTTVENVL